MEENKKCKYQPTERTFLYIMIVWILLFGSLELVDNKHKEIITRLDRIEKVLYINESGMKLQGNNTFDVENAK
jgi:hypothetical protein